MLQLRSKEKKIIAGLTNYRDLNIEHILESGDKTLSFSFSKKNKFYEDIEEECYICTKDHEFVVKEKNILGEWVDFKCYLNLEDLEGNPFDRFESVEQTIDKCLNLALVGTGWVASIKDNITKKRTVRATNTSSLDIIKLIKKTYRIEIEYDTLNKVVNVYEEIGEDKGVYFIEQLNLESLDVQGNSYDYVTRIIPIGKEGLSIESINNGKNYVENYQYSNKIKTIYWIDERYTSKESLKEDAEAKLKELSIPYRAYSAVINLAKINSKYKDILDYKIGDTITIVSKSNKVREKQRIIKLREWLDDHSKDTVEIANTTLSFEDIQTEFENAAEIIDNITTDNGTIDGSTIDGIETDQIKDFETNVGKIVNLEAIKAEIKNLKADKADIQDLNAVNAKIGTLQATKADITELNAVNATINSLQANKADITELNAISGKITVLESETAKIGVLESNVANIQDLINGNLSSENIQTGAITGDRLNMDTIFVKDANMINVNISALKAGDISTNKFKIKSDDGGIEIVGATQQFKDKNNKVRIQMGKDTKGNFNFILRGEDGTTTLIDHNGIKEKAIADNLIKENMVAPDTIGEKAINYNSFATGFNKDSNTSTIKGTKVRLDNQNQTLEVAFTSLKNQSDNTKSTVESHTTELSVQQGKISTLIADTSIVKDGQTIKLKDDYNSTVATVNSMKNTINSHTTKIDANTGKITGVESKTNVLERNLNSMSSKLTSTEQIVSNHTTQISQAQGTANTANSKADNAQSVANNANNKIDNLEIGGRNLWINKNCGSYRGGNLYKIEGFVVNGAEITVSGNPKDIIGCRIDNIEKNKQIIIKGETDLNTVNCYYRFENNEQNSINIQSNNGKFKFTLSVPSNSSYLILGLGQYPYVGNYKISYISVSNGTKDLDWSLSPEDVQVQIDENKSNIVKVNTEVTSTKNKVSTIEQNMDSITQRVGSVETITTSHTTTINNHTNSINAVDGKINTAKAQALNDAKAFTNGEITKVNTTMNSKFAEIKTTTDAINLQVSDTKKEVEKVNVKVDNVKVGIRNLIPDTDFSKDKKSKYKAWGSATVIEYSKEPTLSGIKRPSQLYVRNTKPTEDNGAFGLVTPKVIGGLMAGKEYTLSFKALSRGNTSHLNYMYIISNETGVANEIFVSEGNKVEINPYNKADKISYVTFTPKKDYPNASILIARTDKIVAETTFNAFGIWDIILTEGNKVNDWVAAPEEVNNNIVEVTTTKITEVKAEIKLTTDNINLEVSKKVNSDAIISSINQTAEAVKIKASKISLEGATTVGDSEQHHILIDKANYSIFDGNKKVGYLGFQNDEKGGHPKLTMGWNGIDVNKDDYFTLHAYPTQTNAENNPASYADLAYRCINYKDWSNIKMYGDGDIRIAAIKDLIITTNFADGKYAGTGENRIAKFAGSSSTYYNGNLQIPAVRNMTNGYGLVLTDDHASNKCAVRVNVDGNGNRFFRPLTTDGNVELGSGSYKWKKVFSNGGVAYSASSEPLARTYNNDPYLDTVIDTLDFTVPIEAYRIHDTKNRQLELNVSSLQNHVLSNLFIHRDYDINENGEKIAEDSIDLTSLLHLALYEIQNLKREIKILKSSN